MENFKTHPSTSWYGANEVGEVCNFKFKRVLTGYKGSKGYIFLDLRTENGRVRIAKHKFIYECFYGHVDSLVYDIDHIDENKSNNDLSNLQKLTRKEHNRKTRLTSKCHGLTISRK